MRPSVALLLAAVISLCTAGTAAAAAAVVPATAAPRQQQLADAWRLTPQQAAAIGRTSEAGKCVRDGVSCNSSTHQRARERFAASPALTWPCHWRRIRVCISPYTPQVYCDVSQPQHTYTGYQVELFRELAKRVTWLANPSAWFFDCMPWTPMVGSLCWRRKHAALLLLHHQCVQYIQCSSADARPAALTAAAPAAVIARTDRRPFVCQRHLPAGAIWHRLSPGAAGEGHAAVLGH